MLRRLFASLFTAALFASTPAMAVMEDYPSVRLQGLDKSVGRTITFEARVGSTIEYGPLYIKINACRKAPPIEKPESAAFLQIWEVPPGQEKSQWVFSGWMFASSPALSAMDHPVYDIWVLDCTGREEPNEEAAAAETDKEADQTTLPESNEETGGAASGETLPTDSEAEETGPSEQTPAADAEIVDSEAEDAPAAPADGALPVETPPGDAPPAATDPSQNEGFTAYDLMRQQQGSEPAAAPVQEQPPVY